MHSSLGPAEAGQAAWGLRGDASGRKLADAIEIQFWIEAGRMELLDKDIQGHCSPGFERVRETFRSNFTNHDELGADVAVIVGGDLVVELWAGAAEAARTQPWERDTITNIWSATKGVAAICFAMIVDRGLASYEDKVSRYWPEFAAEGKTDVTIGMLLSHQAGVCGFTTPATLEDLLAGEPAAQRLAAQAPFWPPGTAAGYHGMSHGVLATALLRRIEGRTIKQFVAEEIAGPFNLDVSIGVRPQDQGRVAEMAPVPALDASMMDPTGARYSVLANPATPGSLSNNAAWRAADLPSANGYSNGRALAELYGLLLHSRAGGKVLVGPDALREATRPRFEGVDLVKGDFTRWAAGFWLNPGELYGPNLEAFGHSGWGGTFAFADPVADLTMGYTMNRMGDKYDADPRRRGLIEAVYACV